MNILPPSRNPVLIGHDEALSQVAAAFTSGRMPHAWLITGIEGVGKATLAWHVAHHVLSGGQNPAGQLDMNHPVARLVAGEAHPDLFVVRRPFDEKTGRFRDSIPVEEVRKMAPFLSMTATHGGWRVILLEEAHALNRHGQNAILKVVEEPPANCLILLTATAPGALLPTIRSRCRVLPLQPLEDRPLAAILARCELDLPPDETQRLIRLAGGSAGFALRIAETEALPLFDELTSLLNDAATPDMIKVHALADRIGRKAETDRFTVIAQLLIEALRRNASDMARSGEAPDLSRALQTWERVRQTFVMAVESSLDKKLAFVQVMGNIQQSL